MLFRTFFRYVRQLAGSKDPPGNQRAMRFKAVFLIGGVAIAPRFHSSNKEKKTKSPIFAALGAAGWQLRASTKSPRESLLAAHNCCLVHPTLSHIPQGGVTRLRRLYQLGPSLTAARGSPRIGRSNSLSGSLSTSTSGVSWCGRNSFKFERCT